MRIVAKTSALLFLVIFSIAASASASTWHVPADFDSVGCAIEAAAHGDIIMIAPGTYTTPFTIYKDLTVKAGSVTPGSVKLNVTSYSLHPPTLLHLEGLTFSGEGCSPVAMITNTVRIFDCEFENFQLGNQGIFVSHADVAFHRCLMQNNNNDSSTFWLSSCESVEFYQCQFLNNSGGLGAAIKDVGCTSVTIRECFFSQNQAVSHGGAIHGCSEMLIESCRFQGNSSSARGGAIYGTGSGDCKIVDCTFIANSAAHGGAVGMDQVFDFQIENTDFISNTASKSGPQGYTNIGGRVSMICCLADPTLWSGDGTVTLENDGCIVGIHQGTQQGTLESVKAMFR